MKFRITTVSLILIVGCVSSIAFAADSNESYGKSASSAWAQPRELVRCATSGKFADPHIYQAVKEPSVAVDSKGNWHMAYLEYAKAEDRFGWNSTTYYVKYWNSTMASPIIVNTVAAPSQGFSIDSASIAMDPQDNISIVYGQTNPNSAISDGYDVVYSIMYTSNASGAWAQPRELVRCATSGKFADPHIYQAVKEPSVAVDSKGNWHMAYLEYAKAEDRFGWNSTTYYVKYWNSTMASPIIVNTVAAPSQGFSIDSASIAMDPQDNISIVYGQTNPNSAISDGYDVVYSIMYTQSAGQSSLELLDGVDFRAGAEVWDDPERLVATKGTAMEGVATDGVARLLLRLPVNDAGNVTFSIEGGTGDPDEDGILRSADRYDEGDSITVSTDMVSGKNYALAIYQAPDSFVRSGHSEDKQATERKLTIKATPTIGSSVQREIKLVRPPLILVHGLWSNPAMWWKGDFRVKLNAAVPGLRIFTVDYSKKNANKFSDNKDVPYYCEGYSILRVKSIFKTNKISMIQADVLGHSMGGLLARIWAGAGEDKYFRDDNFRKGDIHKLITLNTPHYGSFLADLGMGCMNHSYTGRKLDFKIGLFLVAEMSGCSFTRGAVLDLMSTSIPIKNMNKTRTGVASHAIAGDYAVSDLSAIPASYAGIHKSLKFLGFDPSPYVITGRSDLVVSLGSQAGGFGSYTLDIFKHHHTDAATDSVVANMVELLNAPSNNRLFSEGFPLKE
ncbi:MAG: hypothetical protein PHI58_02810 [Candidatus Omnitrophica bacterium]|nr:hypothetical protein [Candidatus Omnitrophota bacterium]